MQWSLARINHPVILPLPLVSPSPLSPGPTYSTHIFHAMPLTGQSLLHTTPILPGESSIYYKINQKGEREKELLGGTYFETV